MSAPYRTPGEVAPQPKNMHDLAEAYANAVARLRVARKAVVEAVARLKAAQEEAYKVQTAEREAAEAAHNALSAFTTFVGDNA